MKMENISNRKGRLMNTPTTSVSKVFKREDSISNLTISKPITIPYTLDEIIIEIYMLDNKAFKLDNMDKITLNDLDTAMSSYKEDDEVQVKNYLAFRN
jgi:hypothetical protein